MPYVLNYRRPDGVVLEVSDPVKAFDTPLAAGLAVFTVFTSEELPGVSEDIKAFLRAVLDAGTRPATHSESGYTFWITPTEE